MGLTSSMYHTCLPACSPNYLIQSFHMASATTPPFLYRSCRDNLRAEQRQSSAARLAVWIVARASKNRERRGEREPTLGSASAMLSLGTEESRRRFAGGGGGVHRVETHFIKLPRLRNCMPVEMLCNSLICLSTESALQSNSVTNIWESQENRSIARPSPVPPAMIPSSAGPEPRRISKPTRNALLPRTRERMRGKKSGWTRIPRPPPSLARPTGRMRTSDLRAAELLRAPAKYRPGIGAFD